MERHTGYHASWNRAGVCAPVRVRCEVTLVLPRAGVRKAARPMTTGGSQSINRLTAHIAGEVQGVGYRAYARRRAQMLGLQGYARNLADGTVEVVAEGPRDALEQLFVVLRRGPASANVTDARASWSAPTGEFSTFSIR